MPNNRNGETKMNGKKNQKTVGWKRHKFHLPCRFWRAYPCGNTLTYYLVKTPQINSLAKSIYQHDYSLCKIWYLIKFVITSCLLFHTTDRVLVVSFAHGAISPFYMFFYYYYSVILFVQINRDQLVDLPKYSNHKLDTYLFCKRTFVWLCKDRYNTMDALYTASFIEIVCLRYLALIAFCLLKVIEPFWTVAALNCWILTKSHRTQNFIALRFAFN